MSARTIQLTDRIYAYLLETSLREPPLLARLRAETAALPDARMQIAPDQGQFMRLLVELMDARRVLEVGTFTGYSALCVALELPAEGQVVTCDIDEHMTQVARRFWAEGGVADKIDLRLGPAVETLDRLIANDGADAFDFAFIDADKENYDNYYERALVLVRPGGLIAIDNVLWHGAVADAARQDKETRAIRALNAKLRDDERVSISLVPIGDGVLLARKRTA